MLSVSSIFEIYEFGVVELVDVSIRGIWMRSDSWKPASSRFEKAEGCHVCVHDVLLVPPSLNMQNPRKHCHPPEGTPNTCEREQCHRCRVSETTN